MATFRKRAGKWRAEIYCLGVRASKTFAAKAAAQEWAVQREAEILEHGGQPSHRNSHTLRDALLRYSENISPTKKGVRWEQVRIKSFINNLDFVEQESGVKQERAKELHGEQARSQAQLKLLDRQFKTEDNKVDLIKEWIKSRNKQK